MAGSGAASSPRSSAELAACEAITMAGERPGPNPTRLPAISSAIPTISHSQAALLFSLVTGKRVGVIADEPPATFGASPATAVGAAAG